MYVYSFCILKLQIQQKSLTDDNSALNGIRLICGNVMNGSFYSESSITSSVGPFGEWNGPIFCPQNSFLVGFSMQLQPNVSNSKVNRQHIFPSFFITYIFTHNVMNIKCLYSKPMENIIWYFVSQEISRFYELLVKLQVQHQYPVRLMVQTKGAIVVCFGPYGHFRPGSFHRGQCSHRLIFTKFTKFPSRFAVYFHSCENSG